MGDRKQLLEEKEGAAQTHKRLLSRNVGPVRDSTVYYEDTNSIFMIVFFPSYSGKRVKKVVRLIWPGRALNEVAWMHLRIRMKGSW